MVGLNLSWQKRLNARGQKAGSRLAGASRTMLEEPACESLAAFGYIRVTA